MLKSDRAKGFILRRWQERSDTEIISESISKWAKKIQPLLDEHMGSLCHHFYDVKSKYSAHY